MSRNETVQVAGLAAAASVTPKAPEHPPVAALRPPRKICDVPPPAVGKTLPKDKIEHLESGGAIEPLATAPRKWTWVNLWASWCGPCKAEIPRLLSWQSKLAAAGAPVTLDFVSLDDDKKQGQAFLSSQQEGGMRSSYWLAEGPARTRFLSALKLPEGAALPVHLLFDGSGALRCQIDGDVDESDYAQLFTLFSKP